MGDGNFSDEDDKRILITDKCKEYHKNVIIPLAKYLFNLDFNLYPDGNRNSYYSHKKSSVLYRFFIPSLGFRPGSVRKQIINEIPEYLYDLDVYQKAHVIAGLFDAESKVSLKQAQIDFSISSRPIWEYIYQFLDYVGIKYSLPGRREGRRPSGEYEICITGRYNIEIFLDFVPMKHPEKIKRLKKFIPLTRC
ncbi:MAG: LAGLIDADG family homing endonuclease [Promethearchaeota archaeon]